MTLAQHIRRHHAVPPDATELTGRELQVLRLISRGASNEAVGIRLNLSINTVRVHMRKLLARLDAHSRAHAVRRGFERGLLAPDPAPTAVSTRPLTEQQLWMLELISRGLTNVRIGQRLTLTETAVVDRIGLLYRKIGARDRAHAVRRGFETGLLWRDSPGGHS